MNHVDRDRAGAARAHGAVVATLQSLTDEQVGQRSLLPGWTVGHVATHIARNAEGHLRMFDAAMLGQIAEMYPGGREQRTADIEAGAGRSAADAHGWKAGEFFRPLRTAITGRLVSPPLFGSMELLGRERTLARLDGALNRLRAEIPA